MRNLLINLRLFWEGAILSYIALFRWLRPPVYLASKILMPLGQILFFTFLGIYATGRESASFYIIGNAIQICAINGIFGVTMTVGEERWTGTLPYLFATPANRLSVFVGRGLVHVLDGMLGVVIGLAWGVILLGLDLSHTDLAALALTILVATVSTSGMGLLLGCLSLITLNVMFVNNTVYFLLLVFSGANLPVSALPSWMQAVSWAMPLTRGIMAAREIIAGASLAQVAPLLTGELLVGAAYVAVGYAMFRWFEFQAKQRGTLESF